MPRLNGVVVKVRYEALGWRACRGRRPQHLGHRGEGLNARPPGSFDAILRCEINSLLGAECRTIKRPLSSAKSGLERR